MENSKKQFDLEREELLKSHKTNENVIKKLTMLYNGQQKKLELFVSMLKNQSTTFKGLKLKFNQFKSKFHLMKSKTNDYKSQVNNTLFIYFIFSIKLL